MGCSREASVIGCFIAPALRLFKVQDFQKPRVSIKNMTRQHDEHNTIFSVWQFISTKLMATLVMTVTRLASLQRVSTMYQVQST